MGLQLCRVLLPDLLEMSAESISEPAVATYSEASLVCFLQHPRSGQSAGSGPSPPAFSFPIRRCGTAWVLCGAAGQAATSRICRTLLFVVVEALSSSSCFVFSPFHTSPALANARLLLLVLSIWCLRCLHAFLLFCCAQRPTSGSLRAA